MAITNIVPIKRTGNKSASATVRDCVNYGINPEKTDGGRLTYTYCCDSRTAANQFLLSKEVYEAGGGVKHKDDRGVLLYHMWQSFKPGEIAPEKALEVGRELAMKFTEGNHAFTVGVHTDREHIHCHIYFNSIKLDCSSKFNNVYNSYKPVREISDNLCLENGLSIVKEPKLSSASKETTKKHWDFKRKGKVSHRNEIREKIKEILGRDGEGGRNKPKSLDELLLLLKKDYSYNYKRRGTSIVLRHNDFKNGIKLSSLKMDLDFSADNKIIADESIKKQNISLLIDIDSNIKAQQSRGYNNWAKGFNLQESAKVLVYLKDMGFGSYGELRSKAENVNKFYDDNIKSQSAVREKIKVIDDKLNNLKEMRAYLKDYYSTKDVFDTYKRSGYNQDYKEKHEGELKLNKAAKDYFDKEGYGRKAGKISKPFPKFTDINAEAKELFSQKSELYGELKKISKNNRNMKDDRKNLNNALNNLEKMLGYDDKLENDPLDKNKGHEITAAKDSDFSL